MARLIEVQLGGGAPPLAIRVGDVLSFAASGGRVRSGGEAIERLGPFLPAVVGTNGQVVAPMGPPGTVLFLARRPGRAGIEVVAGDPFGKHRTTAFEVTVEP